MAVEVLRPVVLASAATLATLSVLLSSVFPTRFPENWFPNHRSATKVAIQKRLDRLAALAASMVQTDPNFRILDRGEETDRHPAHSHHAMQD